MMNGGGQLPMPSQPTQPSGTHSGIRRHPTAEVRIIEQPASKALRFRYECEGRSAGSIPGASSTPENKTFPEIQVVGYQGRAVVVVSCVTKDEPYLVHPHNLVGREGCKNGVCTLVIPPETMRVQFSNLGIQCVKKRDIESSLRQREQIRVDPFRQGYSHRNQPTSIDLNAVRLCFQVFLEGERDGKFTVPLRPVVSDVIYDKKAMSDLSIIKLSDCVSHVDGGRRDIILLCEKVAKEDIEIHFYEERDGQRVWQAKADFQPTQVHKQHAIWFRPPRYHTLEISEPVDVFIQLYRPSDRVTSEPTRFQLLPLNAVLLDEKSHKRKRAKTDNSEVFANLAENDKLNMQHVLNTNQMTVKMEPRDATSPYGGTSTYGGTSPYGGVMYSVSPNYAPSPALSPQYSELAPTPSPENNHYQYRQQPVNIGNYNIMPEMKTDQTWNNGTWAPQNLQQTWNFPSTSENMATAQVDILDLDNHQINSGDLQNTIQGMNMPVGPLLEINSLSLTDIEPQNMSDSLTNFLNETANKMIK